MMQYTFITTNVVSSNPAQARCIRYNIMWRSLSVTCERYDIVEILPKVALTPKINQLTNIQVEYTSVHRFLIAVTVTRAERGVVVFNATLNNISVISCIICYVELYTCFKISRFYRYKYTHENVQHWGLIIYK
jgi:hypothetical protein